MEARVDVQAVLQLSTREETLCEHRSKEDGQRIVVPEAGNLDAHLYPAVLALPFPVADAVVHKHMVVLAQHRPLRRPIDLCLDANKRLCAVLESDAGAAVCAGEHVVLGAHGAEVARALCDIEAEGRRVGEGGAQEGELGGREVDEGGVGRHCGGRRSLWARRVGGWACARWP